MLDDEGSNNHDQPLAAAKGKSVTWAATIEDLITSGRSNGKLRVSKPGDLRITRPHAAGNPFTRRLGCTSSNCQNSSLCDACRVAVCDGYEQLASKQADMTGHETTVRAIGTVRGLAVHADYADPDASTLRTALQECANAINAGQPVRLLCACPMHMRCHRDTARERVLHMARAPRATQQPSEQTRQSAVQQDSAENTISSTWTESQMEAGPPSWPISDPRWCGTTACDFRWLQRWPHESRVATADAPAAAADVAAAASTAGVAEPQQQAARRANPPPPPVPPEPPPKTQAMCIRLPVCTHADVVACKGVIFMMTADWGIGVKAVLLPPGGGQVFGISGVFKNNKEATNAARAAVDNAWQVGNPVPTASDAEGTPPESFWAGMLDGVHIVVLPLGSLNASITPLRSCAQRAHFTIKPAYGAC